MQLVTLCRRASGPGNGLVNVSFHSQLHSLAVCLKLLYRPNEIRALKSEDGNQSFILSHCEALNTERLDACDEAPRIRGKEKQWRRENG